MKKNLLAKDIIKKLESFDIRKFSPDKKEWIERLFRNDPWMTFAWIRRESVFASNLFKWIKAMTAYIEVAN